MPTHIPVKEGYYSYEMVARHAVAKIEVIDLDADPTGHTVRVEEVYCLPKKYVDEQIAAQHSSRIEAESDMWPEQKR